MLECFRLALDVAVFYKGYKLSITIDDVKEFWDKNPVGSSAINEEFGSEMYFKKGDAFREKNESLEFSYNLHEYPSFSGKKVLDIGCGNGYVLSHYAKNGAFVTGIDITQTAVDITKSRFRSLGLSGDIFVANAEELPFEDNTFDCVCSMGVLHHTPNTQKAINEAYRVLRGGGRLIMMFYHKNSLLSMWNFNMLPFIHPRYLGMSRKELLNAVDGFGNPKGDMYSNDELRSMMSEFRYVYVFNKLVQKWMFWPIGYLLPKGFLESFEGKLGWFSYVKAWK